MLNDFNHIKHAQQLHQRMYKINCNYRAAFRGGFGAYAVVFVCMLFYIYSKFLTIGIAYTNHIVDNELFKTADFQWLPDAAQLCFVTLSAVFSFLAFRMRKKIPKFGLLVSNAILLTICIVKIIKGEDFSITAAAIIACIISTVMDIICLRNSREEETLSKLDGYLHFNPLLMNEAPVENEEIKYRFADKKSMETLNEERDIKYFEEHPESESAVLCQIHHPSPASFCGTGVCLGWRYMRPSSSYRMSKRSKCPLLLHFIPLPDLPGKL